MAWIPVCRYGAVTGAPRCPERPLMALLEHTVFHEHLEGMKRGQEFVQVKYRRDVPAAAAWYKILEEPDARSGFKWKIGVSYWDARGDANRIRFGTQWLYVYQRRTTYIMTFARDYFFVDVPWHRTNWPNDGYWSEVSDETSLPEDPHQEPQEEPQAGVTQV